LAVEGSEKDKRSRREFFGSFNELEGARDQDKSPDKNCEQKGKVVV